MTNPCFELWYLIHFQDHFAQITRDRLVNLLEKHIPDYDKSMCLYPTPLKSLTEQAIQRAEKMAKQIERNELSEHSNPCCSGLAKLISSLLSLKNS
ncbi:RloB family protein [Nostoc sp.]|uniref:RloB family protein n=1 Tax=Nostoc sp. TaxID=1180 RepID=UPI002FF90E64